MPYSFTLGEDDFETKKNIVYSLIPSKPEEYTTIPELKEILGEAINHDTLILILSRLSEEGKLEYKDAKLKYMGRFRKRNENQ